ncbi:splicing factor 3B subunit 1-like [Dorcoceras hygrometricum]|uniref:Splicing factor 3B subunit 1-like n=1 Tax=Dorcoceras hygrometricum TaxID=472368 RepID=A0A2Z7CHB2_9LAMI|nr:splicing factor 3B subunit 1-like [Dorcoceras hygrometricum]
MEIDFVEPWITRPAEIELEHSIAVNDEDDNLDGAENETARKLASFLAPKQFLKEPLRSGEDDNMSGFKQPSKKIEIEKRNDKEKEIEPVVTEELSLEKTTNIEDTEPLSKAVELTEKPSMSDEDLMSLEDLLKQIPDDMMMPSVTAAEPTKIKFGQGIEIMEMDLYKASLPQIAADDKGKEPLVVDTIQGHPAREIFSLICADIDFLVQLREQVIEEIVQFFNSFSLCRLTVLDSVNDIAAKEELVLTWAETYSVHIALQRRVYIIAKYREMLLRKFLEAIRHNFVSGTATTAIDLKILDLLTASHHFSLKILLRQMKEHKLEWTRPYSSHLAMILVDGSWLIVEGVDYWRPISKPVDSHKWEMLPQRPYYAFVEPVQDLDSRSPFSRLIRDHWTEVCVAVVQFSLVEFFRPVAYINRGRDDKKEESGSSRGPQPPLEDKSRPSGGGGSRSEPPNKRGSGGSQSGPRQRDWRYWIGGS